MAVPAEHQHQVFAGTAHLPSGRLPLRAAPRRYVGLLTDTMRRPGWRPEIARAQKPPRLHRYRPRGTTINTPTGPPAQSQTRAEDGSGAAPPAPPRQTMQAIVQAGYGSDALGRAAIDISVIGDDEVLIRLQAADLDRGTWHLMTGKPYLIRL